MVGDGASIASYSTTVVYEQTAPLTHRTALEQSISVLSTDRQRHTLAHRHDTGGFGTPMLVVLLSIFQHRRREEQVTGQDRPIAAIDRLLPGEEVQVCLIDDHQPSHSISTELSYFIGSPSLSSNQQL